MRLLVLGGTSFVGRAIVEEAVARGHALTLFSRGRTGADLFSALDRRIGDRDDGDYRSLVGGSWDGVVDVSAYVPRHVGQAADALGSVDSRYLFISTGSVYEDGGEGGATVEDAPRWPAERSTEQITSDTYGPLKVACEDDVLARFGDRATIVRPGIVAGPHDPTDRFTYWARRAARGGRVALPGRSDQPVQVLDSRDLAQLVVTLLERDAPGIYNAVGPDEPTTMAGLINACGRAAGADLEVVEIDSAGLPAGLPLVLADSSMDPAFRRSAAKARNAGLPATPLIRTATDVLSWDRQRGLPTLPVGLSPEAEAALLV